MKREHEQETSKIIGQNIRYFRTKMGLSQMKLGDMLGVTFQQIQKYEKGDTRIYATTLYSIATYLKTPVADFFKTLPIQQASQQRVGLEKIFNDIADLPAARRRTVALVVNMIKMQNRTKTDLKN